MIKPDHLTTSTKVRVVNSENVDRISNLPDKLLSHILAFLPTRSAVATCVLAKRWTYVWTETPIIDFTDLPSSLTGPVTVFNQEQNANFKNFVNRVLLHNRTPCLDRVNFKAYKGFTSGQVYEWISVLARRCAREICVIIKDLPMTLSSTFFLSRENLTVLKLEGTFRICLPSSLHLPCLKSLSLVKVVFLDELDPLTKLLSSSAVLEMVNIDSCKELEKFSVCSSSVKILRILSENDRKEAIVINTPNLEVLYLSIGITRESFVIDLSSLVEARLDVFTSSVRFKELLQKICYTKSLILYRIILMDDSNSLKGMLNFQNLTHLEAGFTSWTIVLQILNNSPNLVSFVIHKFMFAWPHTNIEQKALSLKTIEYYSFDVDEGYEVLRYFLCNSTLLEEFKIHTRSWLDSDAENKILKVLLKLPRASKQCGISIASEGSNWDTEDSETESDDTSSVGDNESNV